ncbi:mechanosensitive ion channel [bacterium]|nr:mechanosensitive ion channel [bacterium]
MISLQSFLSKLISENQLIIITNEPRQFLFSASLLFIGFISVAFLFRFLKKRLDIRKDETEQPFWNLNQHTLSLRWICYAGILRLAELPVDLQPMQLEVLHFFESLIVAIAILAFLFSLINRASQYVIKPSSLFQDDHVIRHLSIIKNISRTLVVLGMVSGFIVAQKSIFASWMLSTSWWRYFLAFTLIILLWIFSMTVGRLLLRITNILGNREENIRLILILKALLWPIRILVVALIVYALKIVFSFPDNVNQILDQTISILSIIAGFLLVYNLLDIIDNEMNRFVEREDNLLNKTFAQMVKLVLRLTVLVIAAIYLIQALSGKPVSALLAGLGIGALAVALAAQDTLKNLFGSVMIMADKPFDIGQRILVDGFDGVVESIGFRSTRIRTLTGHQATIPNEIMASQSIENVGRRPHIRRLTNIGITYDTPPEKVEKALQLVRAILENHDGMDPEFPPRVYFDEFNDYSLNLKMIYWFYPNDYWAFMEFTEKINLKIMKAFEAEGIEFAFPTSTTYLAQDDRRKLNVNINQVKEDL